MGNHQRNDTKDKGERGHQNRPQSNTSGFDGRIENRDTFLLQPSSAEPATFLKVLLISLSQFLKAMPGHDQPTKQNPRQSTANRGSDCAPLDSVAGLSERR
jgi:hypothetical protein